MAVCGGKRWFVVVYGGMWWGMVVRGEAVVVYGGVWWGISDDVRDGHGGHRLPQIFAMPPKYPTSIIGLCVSVHTMKIIGQKIHAPPPYDSPNKKS